MNYMYGHWGQGQFRAFEYTHSTTSKINFFRTLRSRSMQLVRSSRTCKCLASTRRIIRKGIPAIAQFVSCQSCDSIFQLLLLLLTMYKCHRSSYPGLCHGKPNEHARTRKVILKKFINV